MKLLLDQNLSHRLARALDDVFPGSRHVREAGLAAALDEEVWIFARREGFTIVSRDSDFRQRSFLHGHPPKVIWLRRGNCSTAQIEGILREARERIAAFEADPDGSLLVLD